ncbi:MAG: precorrin-6y C5,15-methyltransferase (decarboxylating) subunit CbiE [Bacteroidales bacterium]|nr:precorrin-6y C5,15-methyltransferase (decarboxylating) subunit CbiE [Bacteroidales bacterium]MBN2750977.1 precorrin-6y C5,15-methyltransferase (decarboxylating) subunit CbiE [Bacteroidales bacterium]
MERIKFFIIGIDDNREQHFSAEVAAIIASHVHFSGGVRHYEIVKPYLPANHHWLPVMVPLAPVVDCYREHQSVVVFASGDPLFFGFANTIMRELPDAEVQVFPSFNSLQLLAHRLLMPYHDMHIVSLTGRPWLRFDEALIHGYEKIGVLTDNREHTPSSIAERMLDYGYNNYQMQVGELLGNNQQERVTTWRLTDVVGQSFASPNCLVLSRTAPRSRPFGIPESDFHLLDGRARMITKMPVRLLSLSLLNLRQRGVFWDVGFCTGSVSVEARLQFPHLQIVAFEQRPEGEALLRANAQRFGAPGIETVIGDFTELDLSLYPKPHAAFIGGHGGKMHAMVAKLSLLLPNDGVIVFNSVSAESRQLFTDAIAQQGFCLQQCIRMQIDDFNAIDVMSAVRQAQPIA